MRIVTVDPRATRSPAPGVSARTVPWVCFEATLTICAEKPLARSAWTAAGAVLPITFGTEDVCADETASVTTDRRVTFAPGSGSCATTVPRGAELERVEMRATRPR